MMMRMVMRMLEEGVRGGGCLEGLRMRELEWGWRMRSMMTERKELRKRKGG
jgi:hypothetical protein